MIRSIIALVTWFVVLAIGIRVDAASLGSGAWDFVLFIASSTITNVGLLAISAGLVGNGDWLAALRRSFLIYVMLISGSVVLFTQSIADPTPEQYGKIAGMTSLICVVTAYRPELFDDFLDRLSIIFRGEKPQA